MLKASSRPSVFHAPTCGASGLRPLNDDLADDFGALVSKDSLGLSSSSTHPSSQPSSLPIYAPMSWSPLSPDRVSPYQLINLNVPSGTSFPPQPALATVDRCPTLHRWKQRPWFAPAAAVSHCTFPVKQIWAGATALAVDGPAYPSPTGPYYPQQIHRRTSDAPTPNLNDLAKGVPLSSVLASWPLCIVEFKAGRTDLFYLTDLRLGIRMDNLSLWRRIEGRTWARL
ncbi:hypothetical protein SCLCIDRAFT_34368 [Scleroderma citrinum Foug A]|uniref:Uncharacterized protein n=1 Tax=Scleroderma citrinum Foug A TaxID=1036808 RepID=A0A0C3CP28_9AGAM|nr:hypothetical protein SCLCIDRAFT_34368 [Scleroderma citrinum Foug A]